MILLLIQPSIVPAPRPTKMIPPPHLWYLVTLGVKLILLFLLGFFSWRVSSQSVVENLPGFHGKLPFRLETGYIGVGESEEVQLFYYFIESEGNPEYDPLMLWLTGGPSCSGLSGLIYEIGPFTFDYDNFVGSIPVLILNPYSWSKVASIIFLDQPAGCGFSYSETPEAYNCSDKLAGKHTYEFLIKWLLSHPKYLNNPLYIAGDSYSGITVPLVVNEVYNGIDVGKKPFLNMKGYVLGNPLTDVYGDFNGRVAFAHRLGLLSDHLYQSVKESCYGYYLSVDPENFLCQDDLKKVHQCIDKIRLSNILEPWCGAFLNWKPDLLSWHMPWYEGIQGRFLQSGPFQAGSWCRDDNYQYSYTWANNKSVQKALHVREGTIPEWVRCNSTIKYEFDYNQTVSYTFDVKTTVDYHKMFSHKDCRALIYSGDHDMVVPHTRTEEWIKSLKLMDQSDWRPWSVGGQIAGYTTSYMHGDYELVYATVKGAGHTAPEYKPQQCLSMIERWLSYRTL